MRTPASDDPRELRRFALALAALCVVLFGLLLPWWRAAPHPWWPWLAGGVLVVLAIGWPRAAYPVYRAWRPLARLLALVNTWILLGLAYYLVLTPLGWVLRRLHRLQYRSGFDRAAASYRVPVARQHRTDLKEPF